MSSLNGGSADAASLAPEGFLAAGSRDGQSRWQSPAPRPELAAPLPPRPVVSLMRRAPQRAGAVGLPWLPLSR